MKVFVHKEMHQKKKKQITRRSLRVSLKKSSTIFQLYSLKPCLKATNLGIRSDHFAYSYLKTSYVYAITVFLLGREKKFMCTLILLVSVDTHGACDVIDDVA